MIYFFISFIFGKTVLDLENVPLGNKKLTLMLQSLDVFEIKVSKGIGTFLSYWEGKDDLYLYVVADSTYGPYDIDSGLAGIFFLTKNYIIRFVNDGPNNISFMLLFDYMVPDIYYEELEDELPIYRVMKPREYLRRINSPFIYYIDKSAARYIIIVMSIILAIIAVIGYICKMSYEYSLEND